MKIFYNIGAFLLNKIEEFNERQLKKKYPNWNPNDWIGDLEFIWGVKSYDCLARCDANIHTMNDIEIDYDHSENKYLLSIETAYIFQDKIAECTYLRGLLKCFEEYMDNNDIEKDCPDGLFIRNIGIDFEADSIQQLYWDFKLYVNGFCSLF